MCMCRVIEFFDPFDFLTLLTFLKIKTNAARVVNDGAAEKTFFFIEHGALSRSDCTDGSFRANEPTTVRKRFHAAGNGFAVVADANREVGVGENE